MASTKRVWAALLLLGLGACGSHPSKLDDLTPDLPKRVGAPVAGDEVTDGLDLRLSNGKAGPPAFDRAKLAPATKLADADLAQLFSRAAPIVADAAADQKAFALRPATAPPPKPGNQVATSFPPPVTAPPPPHPVVASAALHVLRYMPEGQVPVAPSLSVTFDQPMVAVTSQEDAAATTPVKLVPQPKGKWRWLGTRTVLFDPDIRFPQATTYTVDVPAATKSATGAAIDKPAHFTFETPPATAVEMWPQTGPTRTDTPIFIAFDQKIDPAAVVAKLKVTASGGWGNDQPIAVKLLDAQTISKRDDALADLVDGAHAREQDGRWLAVLPTKPLPADTLINVEIPAGTPSAEGPNLTTKAQSFSFRTYPPMQLTEAWCSYKNEHCRPGTTIEILFNNPIDAAAFDPDSVKIEPAVPGGIHVQPSGTALYISGQTRARTEYTVTVPASLSDTFGQILGKAEHRSFTVTDADPTFYGANGIVVLDPAAKKPTLDFFTTNYDGLAVQLYKVEPSDWAAYQQYEATRYQTPPPAPPGKKVFDKVVQTGGGKNLLVEDHIDLAPALDKDGLGHVVAIVTPTPWDKKQYGDRPPQMTAWVQATHLGLSLTYDKTMHVFASDLATGAPAAGVALAYHGNTATSDATGLAALGAGITNDPVVAKKGADTAFVLPNAYARYGFDEDRKQLAWYVVDDRHLYRPGEVVHLKGWLRVIDRGLGGDVDLLAKSSLSEPLAYRVLDARSNELSKGTVAVSPAGGFDLTFPLPKQPNLGSARVEFTASTTGLFPPNRASQGYTHYLQLEEFRRPEFEVHANASQGPFVVGDSGDVTVDAKYFAGGGLAGAPVHWVASTSQTSFTPPNRDDYSFGSWHPWWRESFGGYGEFGGMAYDDEMPRYYGGGGRGGGRGANGKKQPRTQWELDAQTDGAGAHVLHLDFLSVKPAVPMSVVTTASVTDVNRQQWSASSSIIVHPATYYVGLKSKVPFVEQGTPFDLDVIGTDLDGALARGAKVDVRAVRLDTQYEKGVYKEKEVEPQTCTVTMPQAAPQGHEHDGAQPCHFQTPKGGSYRATATIKDPKGRENTTSISFWVSGGEQLPARTISEEKIQVIPDKKTYAPGNTAELLVMSPFYPAEGVVTWRRGGIVKLDRITLTGPTKVITVPIDDAMTPNLYVRVDVVGAAARLTDAGAIDPKLPKRPAYAAGGVELSIPPVQRTLTVRAAPSVAKLSPGGEASIEVAVTDAAGKPVADAETAVIVVDESILSLAAYSHPDPVGTFYPMRGADTTDTQSRAMIALARPDQTVATTTPTMPAGPGGGNGASAGSGSMAMDAVALPPSTVAATPAEPEKPMDGRFMMQKQEAQSPALEREAAIEQARNAGVLGGLKFKNGDGKDDDITKKPPGADTTPIAIRSNFDPLAAFAPSATTDASGKATVHIAKLPDNLTRYRIVAIAVAGGKQYGKGESAITARLPLMVRPSAPRFLNFGDVFQLPVVVQNQTDAAMTVRVGARATNAKLTDGGGREVTVPPNDRVEVRFPATTEMAGTARFQFVASTQGAADAAQVELPVWTPATTEAFATYGVIDDTVAGGAIAQPIALPGDVVKEYGGLEVSTSSTQLASLTDALLYIVHYPYECSEQRSSRVMSIAALKDVLAAFHAPGLPAPAALAASNDVDIAKIAQLQNGDGGFVYWERGYPSEPFLSVYVTHALLLAKQKGYAVPEATLMHANAFLQNIEQHYPTQPFEYPIEVKRAISAYALVTRKLYGDLDIAKGQKLLAEAGGPEKLNLETDAWLLQLFAKNDKAASERAAIVHYAMQKVSETAGAANFTTAYSDGGYLLLASDRRTDALMLQAMIDEQPTSDLIPKIVTGLLAHKTKGRWESTQENTWVLLALDHYFQTYEKAAPNFAARVWLGDAYAGDHGFRGHTTDEWDLAIAMADVAAHDKQALEIQKDGTGRLYYRVGMKYAPSSLALAAADYGFVVTRTYEGVDDPSDVKRGADGVWHVKAGARVRVKLAMMNENRRYHVALVDPMPAGFEALNPALATTPPVPPEAPKPQADGGRYWWWYRTWYEHQNLRDDRVEAFTQLLWEGVHDYTYVARATTPGNFVVPPTKAEEMYMPETFGRSASDRVVVE